MKYTKYIIIISIFLFGSINAQEKNINDLIKASADKLFEFCENEKYDSSATMIAYSGKEEKRNLKTAYNYKDIKEASKVKRIAKKIKAFLSISDSYSFGAFNVETTNNTSIYSIEVIFISGEQKLNTLFSFVEINNKFLLADLN